MGRPGAAHCGPHACHFMPVAGLQGTGVSKWISGNQFQLLENGEEFFPRVFDCIAAAERDVVVETFILFEDKVGQALHAALLKAAARGAQVDLTIDEIGRAHV